MTWRRVKPAELGIELSIESKGFRHVGVIVEGVVECVIVEALRHAAGA
ncbi:hypothetical protein ABZ307_14800 [Streptomyces griseorubiginosus]